jgi:prepilin-type N-terminal cleavage/methylation domain-containing protein
MPRRTRTAAGFSLIELLIVISIMGVLAAMAIPSLNASLHDQLQSAAQIVASDLSYGGSLAVANGSNYRFTFDLPNNRYILEHTGANGALATLPRTPFRSPQDPPTQHIFDLDELPRIGAAIRLTAVGTTGTAPQKVTTLEFDQLGATTRNEETAIWLTGGFGSDARYISVLVNPVTGIASVGNFQGAAPPAAIR